MIFGGFQSVSLSDFPGRPAAILFAQGCNYRCPFCHNARLLPLQSDGCFDDDTAMALLQRQHKLIDGVVFSGGEPTLQPDIVDVIRRVRNELSLSVKLDTNGSHPEVLRTLLDAGLLDYIAMDVKAPWDCYPRLTGTPDCRVADVRESVRLIAASGVRYEFRTTVAPELLTPEDVERIQAGLPDGAVYKTQAFIAEHALYLKAAVERK
ncbi:MAG: anaerobic ribonucleoside-triphosphate reductase activating protein [Kiritimatiellia bacterium]|jgi:pyruvate formate lyase activating enzyme